MLNADEIRQIKQQAVQNHENNCEYDEYSKFFSENLTWHVEYIESVVDAKIVDSAEEQHDSLVFSFSVHNKDFSNIEFGLENTTDEAYYEYVIGRYIHDFSGRRYSFKNESERSEYAFYLVNELVRRYLARGFGAVVQIRGLQSSGGRSVKSDPSKLDILIDWGYPRSRPDDFASQYGRRRPQSRKG